MTLENMKYKSYPTLNHRYAVKS